MNTQTYMERLEDHGFKADFVFQEWRRGETGVIIGLISRIKISGPLVAEKGGEPSRPWVTDAIIEEMRGNVFVYFLAQGATPADDAAYLNALAAAKADDSQEGRG